MRRYQTGAIIGATHAHPVIGINERPVRAIEKSRLCPVTTCLHEKRQAWFRKKRVPEKQGDLELRMITRCRCSTVEKSRGLKEGHNPRRIRSQGDSIHKDSIYCFDMSGIIVYPRMTPLTRCLWCCLDPGNRLDMSVVDGRQRQLLCIVKFYGYAIIGLIPSCQEFTETNTSMTLSVKSGG